MPQQKRSLGESDPNAQQPESKRTSTPKPPEDDPQSAVGNEPATEVVESGGEAKSSDDKHGLDKKKPEEYICINRPLFDFVAERQEKNDAAEVIDDEEDEEDEEEAAFEEYRQAAQGPNKMWPKPAEENPDWKWIMMADSWKMFCKLRVKQSYVDPDNFGMHVFSDFYGYGICSLIEDMLNDFDKEYKKKKEDRSVYHLWAIMATLGHWMNEDETISPLSGIDDSTRLDALVALIGVAFLSTLDAIDKDGKLNQESEFRDLVLVMSLYLQWSRELAVDDNGVLIWRDMVVAYAKKSGIDLKENGCYGITETLEGLDEEPGPIPDKPADQWKWPSNFTEYKTKFGFVSSSIPFQLPCFDITKWPRKLRAKWNFDNVDPLADIPEKDLKEGNILFS